jgi:hypothetical protein
MIKQTMLPFKLKMSQEDITTGRSGLALYAEFLRAIGLKQMVQRYMPAPGSNRGYGAWQFIEPLMLMLCGEGRHLEDVREIAEDKALRRLIGLRWALIEIPGKLISHGGSKILNLAAAEEKFQIYLNMRHCCLEFT